MIKVARKQAATRIGNTQRAVDKHFQLHLGAKLANFLNLIQRQLARQNDTFKTHGLPEFHCGEIDRIGLHRKVNRHVWPFFMHHHDEAWVGHNQRVWLHGDHRRHICHISFHLGVMRRNIARYKKLFATRMCLINADSKIGDGKIIIARPQAITRLTRINRICPIIKSSTHAVKVASRG